jgi:lysophospholipase L1-like esterase
MDGRAVRLILVGVLVAACSGSGATATVGSPTSGPSLTAPAVATAAPALSPPAKPMNVVWISDSSGSGGVPEAYGRRIEADLGVTVQVQSAWTGGLSIKRILDVLQGAEDGVIQTVGSGKVNLSDLVRDADVIVVSGNPLRSDTPGHPQGQGCPEYFDPNPPDDPVTESGPETWQQYEANIVAVIDEIFKFREGRPVILRTHDWYLPWGPLATWTSLDRVDACVAAWHEFSAAIHRAAAQRNVPVAGYYAAFSGPNGDQPLPSAWTSDDVHPSAAGAEALAGVMADLGYDLVAPPGG